MMKDLSIVFPAFNEERRLKTTFKELIKFKNKFKNKLEIIFVDDGSSDSTYKLVNIFKKKSSKNCKIISIRIKKNMGKGYALKRGIEKSSKTWILTTDVDLSVPLKQIFKWNNKKFLSNKSILFGSRNLKNSKVNTRIYRYALGKIFNFLIKFILGISIKDTQCGFKLYNKKTAKILFKELNDYSFTHDLEIVILAKKKGISIQEFPVTWTHKKGSKLNIFLDPVRMFFKILLLRYNLSLN